jgi:hypothetical protein
MNKTLEIFTYEVLSGLQWIKLLNILFGKQTNFE